jgi:hypothetical protein
VRVGRRCAEQRLVYSGRVLALAGPLAIAAVVLAVGGVAKLRAPAAASPAFTALHLPSQPSFLRLFGAGEVLLGAAAFVWGGAVLAGAVGVLYVGFAVSAAVLSRRGGTSCGCFGAESSETTPMHVVVDVLIAATALVAAMTGAPGLVGVVDDLGFAAVVYVASVALGLWLVVAVLTVLPDAMVAARRTPAAPTVRTFEIDRPYEIRGTGS